MNDAPRPKLRPNLMVDDVRKSMHFYRDILGFDIAMRVPQENTVLEPDDPSKTLRFGVVKTEGIEIFFQSKESLAEDLPAFADTTELGGSFALYIECDDVVSLYERIKDKVEILSPPTLTWYGMKEIHIRDNSGYTLSFGEMVETPEET